MSISSALNSAVSGLTTSARAADVTSANLANVLTKGYAPRLLELETMGAGHPGVAISGIARRVDPGLLADRRVADGALAYADTRAGFLTSLQGTLGTPDDSASLSGWLAAFEASLLFAANNPENVTALQDVVVRAGELTQSFNTASSAIQDQRAQAERRISNDVDRANTLLANIRQLNIEISNHTQKDHLSASLLDHRQQQIDELAVLIPVRQVPRNNGAVALFTPGGAILLDGTAATLEFTAGNTVAPHMTLDNNLLSGLTINDVAVSPSGANSPIDGGQLAALFSVRDDLAVDAQIQLDALARNLIERFQQPGVDATTAPGDPGLFADNAIAFSPLNEVGVAGRISLNTAVDPGQGGEVWHLRDGLGAAAQGPAGNSALLARLAAALSSDTALGSGDMGGTSRAFSGHLATYDSRLGNDRLTLDQALTFASARQSEFSALEAEDGVDSDAELQRLLLIEQAYGANARMIETLDDMMQTLLRI